MKMGISWNYSICYCYNDYDTRSLTTSGLLPYFLFTQYLLVLVFMMCYAIAWSKSRQKIKAANKKALRSSSGLSAAEWFSFAESSIWLYRIYDLTSSNLRFDFIESTISSYALGNWSFPLFAWSKSGQKIKAANKKTAFGLNCALHQCQVRPGDFLIANRNFPVLLSIDFDLNSFLFEARV